MYSLYSEADKVRFEHDGESQLQLQLRKETYEIEEAHRRRADRAGRIAELQGSSEPAAVIRRVDPSIDPEEYTCAELYLHLRDNLEERMALAAANPTPKTESPIHKRQPTRAQAAALGEPRGIFLPSRSTPPSPRAAQGMTRKDVATSLRLARMASSKRLESEGALDCMRSA